MLIESKTRKNTEPNINKKENQNLITTAIKYNEWINNKKAA